MKSKSLFISCAVFTSALIPSSAQAALIDAAWSNWVQSNATYQGVDYNQATLLAPGATSVTSTAAPNGALTAWTETGSAPLPFVSSSISANFNGVGLVFGDAVATLDFQFQINGPTAYVPLQINAMGFASLSPQAPGAPAWLNQLAIANFSVSGLLSEQIWLDYSGGLFGQFITNGVYLAETNRVYDVHMASQVGGYIVGGYGGGSLEYSAFVRDPTFRIVPTNPNEPNGSNYDVSQYIIEFSPGIENSSGAVPDGISTAALLGTALLGLAALRRRFGRA